MVHDVDDRVAALVAGLRHDGLPVADVVDLLGAARGEDIDPASVGDVIAGLVRTVSSSRPERAGGSLMNFSDRPGICAGQSLADQESEQPFRN